MDAEDIESVSLNLAALLPLRAISITLEFSDTSRFNFYPQPAITAFVRRLLDSPDDYDTRLMVDCAEVGRHIYRSGDHFCFSVMALSDGEGLLDELIKKLQRLPSDMPNSSGRMPLADNVQLYQVTDTFTGKPVTTSRELTIYDMASLSDEVAIWQHAFSPIRLRWLAPVRLLKNKEDRPKRGELRYCRAPEDIDAELLLCRLHDSFADLLRRRGCQTIPRRAVPPVNISFSDLFWADTQYRDESGKSKEMGGMLGQMELVWRSPLSIETLQQLILGQYIGIGQRRAFGWGRYRLESPEGDCTLVRVSPASSLLGHVIREDNMLAAWMAVAENQSSRKNSGSHTASSQQVESELETVGQQSVPDDLIQKISEQLGRGNMPAAQLKGVVLRESDGDLRALAVPPFWDRVAQRAVAQTLSSALDTIMYSGSYGYRPNLSRQKAAFYIQTLYRKGYRWAFESDIEDFFDSVDLRHLLLRLESFYDEDPVIGQVMRWMQAPVNYQGQIIERERGLPQGSPLSPLMANLLLDDFDDDLEAHGFKLVRYADDFIILARKREEAEQASKLVKQSLADWGLRLNQSKTRIVPFDQGFKYLGYLFVNDLVLDVGGTKETPQVKQRDERPLSGWLGRISAKTPLAISAEGKIKTQYRKKEIHSKMVPQQAPDIITVGERNRQGLLLTVTGEPCLISTHEGRLNVQRDESTLVDEPITAFHTLLLIGRHHITTPALRAAMDKGVPIHFATAQGKYEGVSWNGQPGSEGARLWLLQQQVFANPVLALEAAQTIVAARLQHQHEVLRQSTRAEKLGDFLNRIDLALKRVVDCNELNQLNGIEGAGARAYFEAIAKILPEQYQFTGRNRRPPADPFNALLSLGYTSLYAHTESMLRLDGFYPWVGFYHQPHGAHATLASDLMEPFRHVIERAALNVSLRGRLKPEDFVQGDHGCFLTRKARRLWFALLEERFETQVKAKHEQESYTILEQIHRQNLRLNDWIRGKTDDFVCFRQR